MSIKVMTYVWDHSPHTGSDLLMLLALADHANDQGRAWPSIPTLAKKCRVQRRQALYILKKLEEAGDITIEHGRGRGHVSVYVVKGAVGCTNCQKGAIECTITEEKVHSSAEKVHSSVRKGALECTRTIIEPSKNLKPKDTPPTPSRPRKGECVTSHTSLLRSGEETKTPAPDSLDAQQALYARLVDASFQAWYASTGLAFELPLEWKRFMLDALAHGRTYVSWSDAFKQWLLSPYRLTAHKATRRQGSSPSTSSDEMRAHLRRREAEKAAKKEVAHG